MADLTDNSIKKTLINLSRNTPVALAVGAAGFLGSSLVEKLLEKRIQVIGVDNFKTGKKENLMSATKDKNFHLLSENAENLDISLERLDYIFIVAGMGWDLKSLLRICQNTKARLLFVSYIDLYSEKDLGNKLKWFKKTESEIARFASDNKLNARILRTGAVFGPRMKFSEQDPMVELIKEAILGDLQKDIPMDFSSRAVFVDDVVDLMVKCILSGATAQRIFDCVSLSPVKVSEVKQILLDPTWYGERGFSQTQLPPWPTPNLERTRRFLNWSIKTDLVEALKKTLAYFKDNEIILEEDIETREIEIKESPTISLSEEKKKEISALKEEERVRKPVAEKGSRYFSKILLLLFICLIVYAFVWPPLSIGFGVLTFRYQINQAVKNLEKGEFDLGLRSVAVASIGIGEAQKMVDSLLVLRKLQFLDKLFETGDNLSQLAEFSADSTKNTILGMQALYYSLRSVTGENTESPRSNFEKAQVYLSLADEDLSKAQALISSNGFESTMPWFLKSNIVGLTEKIKDYTALVKKGRAISVILPDIVAIDSAKTYLILLQNNMELRPTGGFIGSFAKVSFESGKLKKLEVNDIYNIDGQLNIHVEPPAEIKTDLGQKDWFLRDSNWEADFPTSARQAEWFYTKETGERVDGVFALDVSAMEDLISVLGPLKLSDYNEEITAENLFEKAVSHAEVSFFAGSQAKKSFITALTNEVFSKLFFVPTQNWPGIVSSLGRSLEQKHLSIYLNNPKLFTYLNSQKWTGEMPKQNVYIPGLVQDFIAPVEANLGANKSNFYLDRSYSLETVIGKEGEINQRLRIAYTNRSPSDTFPGGKYKDRFRVYLPFGAKLNRALWAETDITGGVTSFVDYGRIGYSVLLLLLPKEQKTLVLDYSLPAKLDFKNGVAKYKLDVIKQAGTKKDPFLWKISYPINYRLIGKESDSLAPQEKLVETDLSVDRSFEVEFRK